jgi:CheY-like chemotaxis protein
MMDKETVTFLIVDDDEVAVMAIRRALNKMRFVNPVEVVGDGQEALDLLRGVNSKALAKPYIILLDLNMPRMGGLEFLAEVREDEELANSVIFVLTTSDAPSDIAKAYEQKIAGYIIKENAYDTVKAAMEMLGAFVEIVSLEGRPQLQAAAQ